MWWFRNDVPMPRWWQIHLIQLPLNEQRETTSLWSFPFVRCIHSDYITWLSKWLCMQIIPSFLVDKASCTRQFESELSLHSLASLFPIKEGIFLPLRLSCKESSTFLTKPLFNSLYDPFDSPCRGQKPQEREDIAGYAIASARVLVSSAKPVP